jgi:hypothetical protein
VTSARNCILLPTGAQELSAHPVCLYTYTHTHLARRWPALNLWRNSLPCAEAEGLTPITRVPCWNLSRACESQSTPTYRASAKLILITFYDCRSSLSSNLSSYFTTKIMYSVLIHFRKLKQLRMSLLCPYSPVPVIFPDCGKLLSS